MIWRPTRRQVLALSGVASVNLILSGCGAVSVRPGLYVAGADGAPRWIDDTSGVPTWSPNGDLVAWGDERGLRIWDASKDELTSLTKAPIVGRPAWSPDSSVIAFLNAQTQVLQTLNFTTKVAVPVAVLHDGPDGVIRPPIVTRGGPAWSPDGSLIAFICWDGRGDELCIVDREGSARQQLTTLGGVEAGTTGTARSSVTTMAWSPDSAALAVAVQAEQKGATAGIFRVELAARVGTRLTKMTVNAPLIWDVTTDELIFSANVEGRSDVYRLPAAGGKPTAITTTLAEGARDPATADDGVLAAVSGSRIAVLSPNSGNVEFREASGLACAAPALRADGSYMAYLALPRPIEGYP